MVVGWIGSPATTPHLASVAPAIAALRDLPGLSVETVGAAPFGIEGVCVTNRPWSEDAETADIARFDVGIMPLPDDPWSRGKCGYKLIQYMATGLPVVASPVGANRRIVEDGVSGFLASDLGAWSSSLRTLHADPALRARFGAAGRARAVAQYSRAAIAPRLLALFESLLHPPGSAHA
jgi:glycosyltransferase involved in cell wall biosynthesis